MGGLKWEMGGTMLWGGKFEIGSAREHIWRLYFTDVIMLDNRGIEGFCKNEGGIPLRHGSAVHHDYTLQSLVSTKIH